MHTWFPLSSAQSGIYLHQCKEQENPLYNVGGYIRLDRPDVPRLQRAHARLVRTHEAFRIRIHVADTQDGARQSLIDGSAVGCDLCLIDLSARKDPNAAAEAWIDALFAQCIPLEDAELHRAALLKLSDSVYWYVGMAHHIAVDGMGFVNWAHTLARYYDEDGADASATMDEPSYADLAARDADYLGSAQYERDRRYWSGQVARFPDGVFANDMTAVADNAKRSVRQRMPLTPQLYRKLGELATRLGVESHAVLLGVLSVYFSQCYSADALVIGIPQHGRQGARERAKIGLFTQMLPLVVEPDVHAGMASLLDCIGRGQRQLLRHRRYPLTGILHPSGNRRPHGQPFDFAYSYVPAGAALAFDTVPAQLVYCSHDHEPNPLLATFWDGGSADSSILLDFNLGCFSVSHIAAFQARMTHLIDQLHEAPDRRLLDLDCVTGQERASLVREAQHCAVEATEAFALDGRISEVAHRDPGRIALECGSQLVTYAELASRIDAVAAALWQDNGVRTGDRVAVLLEHSAELVIVLMALVRLGAVYVPIDAQSPAARTRHILEDCGATLLVGDMALQPEPTGLRRVTLLELCNRGGHAVRPASEPADADGALYVLYTSGSTGLPKGVLIHRRSARNLLGSLLARLGTVEGGRWLFMSSVGFDISIVEWLGCLGSAGTCVIPSAAQLADPFALADLANKAKLSLLQSTPSRLKQLRSAGWRPCSGQLVISAGEPLPQELAQDLLACGVVLWNGYGPTEATVYSLVKRVDDAEPAELRVAIGDQLPGYRHYVLNRWQRLIPAGLTGELVIAGAGLAAGYLNREELTARQFVVPQRLPETRLYRTGDMVRQLGGACFRYLGRNDDQIKLRGYRIELGEIRSVLLATPGVRDAAVVHRAAVADRPAHLSAYLCAKAGEDPSTMLEAARAHAKQHLPAYMVPATFTALPALPINTNGKLDSARLPAAEPQNAEQPHSLESATECLIAAHWSELLGLRLDSLGGQSDFFALGGDSVLAVRMVARLRAATGNHVETADLFKYPRLSDLAARVDTLGPWQARLPPAAAADHAQVPASMVQRQLWLLSQQDPRSTRYNMTAGYRLEGALHVDVLQTALERLVERHHALRTVFRDGDQGLVQFLLPVRGWSLEQVDASAEEETLRVQAAKAEHEAFARRPFDLGHDYPFRARLIALSRRESVLLLSVHHIAADGASVEIALREFLADHAAATRGRDSWMPAPVRQFTDFAAWQDAMLSGNAWAEQLEYWKDRLAGLPPTHALPPPRSHKASGSAPDAVDSVLARPLVDRLRAYAKRAAATEFSVLQSALALTLCKWSYSDTIVIGSPVRGRTAAEFEGSVGMFVNMLAYPHRFTHGERFADYLARFQRDAARALDHQDLPFEAIVEALQPPREAGRHPLFQVVFAFQDELPDVIDAGGLRLQRLPDPAPVAKYELECLVARASDGWSCRWLAAPGVMETDVLRSLADAFASALEQLVCMPDRAMAQICLASTPSAMGEPARPATVAGVHELISAQARSCPAAVALRWGEQAVSYLELEQRSNRLARLLLQRGVRPGERVALCLPRGPLQIISTLAVLKAGAAYVPVDPGYPPARIAYLLDDAAPACVLATSTLAEEVAALVQSRGALMLDDGTMDAALTVLPATAIAAAEVGLSPDSDAYVIHTSGSTGQPKGVLIGHRGLINLALAQADAFGIDAHARVLQFASPSFDAAVSEWSTTLSAGAELVLVPEDVLPDAQALTAWALRYRVTHATLPPTVLRRLSPQAWPTLTHVISAGEAVTLDEARRWAAHCRFINAYGPSEATVCATVGGISDSSGDVTIGRAMGGLTLYVVDRDLRPLPEGAVGELCIAGVALAKGYLNKPEQTRLAFVELECEDGQRRRVYRTGDRVRRLADGELAFEGRLDEQVKIRGHRVECGEVEARLAAFPGIREAAVGTRDVPGGDRVLVAYLAVDGEFAGDARIEALRQHLLGALPGFMVPSSFVLLDALPLNQSGKVDRKALAARDDVVAATTPRRSLTATESIVRDLWVELLGPQANDPDRGFFELGGYSLLVSDALAALRNRFGIAVGYRQFFDHPTIAALAAFIDRQPRALQQEADDTVAPSTAGGQGGSYPLSFEQQRLWFIDQLEQGSQHYNMPVALQLRGRVEAALIEAALQRIVARHESLRTTFSTGADGAPVQSVRHDLGLRLEHRQVPREAGAEWTQRLRQQEQEMPFDLADALMLRARLLSVADDEAVLFLTLHHIAADGWSVDRLIAEFGALYGAMLEGRPDPLPALPLQYGQHAAMQRAQALGGGLEAGLQFWRTRLQGVPACHSLPLDAPRGATASLRGRAWTSRIPAALAARLAGLGRAHDTTLFVVLQSAFAVLVSRWSEHRDIVIGTPIANRHRAELGQLIGFFANTLVVRTDCKRNVPFATLLLESRAAFLDGFAHQHVPFEMVVEATGTVRTAAHSPLVQLLFSYGENPQAKLASLRIPGLAVKVLDEDGPRPVKFDLELAISGGEDGLACQWLFDTSLFQPQTIERFADSFTCLLESLLAHPALG
ncbi:non-ribosomal peptide synthetase, partial [uncultured Xanthomonas sp.]|uniref:amino acid adenylation domain-containing protein n=1 Tax=uncultured Xanthomonas sp. TaxID=152831 RepID=UPI0025D4CE7A